MSVRVVARIRPLLGEKELEKDIIVHADRSEKGKPCNIVKIPSPKNGAEEFSFTFGSVYDMATTQEELFTNEVSPHLKNLFQGLDVTIFAYGVTGTGKTHTMRGGTKLADRGVIPRLLSGIYRRGRKVAKDTANATTISVTLSYYEIYNDKVFDLFEPIDKRTPSGLPLREKDGKTIVVGLSEHSCDDLKDFERLYIEANNNRSTGATKLNAQSSRSHAILMVKLTQITGDEIKTSTASAIDLAGSEDNRRTENGKERMIESAAINKSLFVLSQCVDAIGRGDKRIPYRESKMTRILSLGQNDGITIMILNLAPLKSYHLDTLSSLNVSSRAKRIEVREIENEIVFKQPPRTTTVTAMSRQPLRAKDHNTHVAGNTAGTAKDKPDKSSKAFSVFADKRLSGGRSVYAQQPLNNRNTGVKRTSDHTMSSRPSKMVRTNPPTQQATMSAAKIEEMVERKVAEILASKTSDTSVAQAESVSEAVQRRLDALERKIENGSADDSRAEGLRFLLMAKQHKERGEDSSALKMYELAVPFFPGQEKLVRKMDVLRAKIKSKKEEQSVEQLSQFVPPPQQAVRKALMPIQQLPTTVASFEATWTPQAVTRPKKLLVHREPTTEDDEDEHSIYIANPEDSPASSTYSPAQTNHHQRSKQPKLVPLQLTSSISHAFDTNRTQQILSIINSRNVTQIMGLSGVGAKKAKDLVGFMEERCGEEGIETLESLRDVPGFGGKTFERIFAAV